MPELPEVESVRRAVSPHIVGKRVTSAELIRRDILVAPGDPMGGFSRQRAQRGVKPLDVTPRDLLEGSTIERVERLGKQLAVIARDAKGREHAMVVQLGMTGRFEYLSKTGDPLAHLHARWRLAGDKGTLVFIDPRRFGALRVFRSLDDLRAHLTGLGPDALTITPKQLEPMLKTAKRAVKAALLDQSLIAGVGNIYADEALFLTRVHPAISAHALPPAIVAELAANIREVLKASIASGGSTIRDYRSADGSPGAYQDDHRVYGRAGKACLVCGTTLKGIRLAQRATVFCPHCQPRTLAKRPAKPAKR